MKVKEWLQSKGENESVTFIIAKAAEEQRYEYKTTPIRPVWEWLHFNRIAENYIIINADHPPIDFSGSWMNQYNRGQLRCAIIVSIEDVYKIYSERQAEDIIKYYDEKSRMVTK